MSVYVARIIHRFERGREVNDIKSFSKKHKLITNNSTKIVKIIKFKDN